MSRLHTSGPRAGLSFSEAWNALDQLDLEQIVVECPTKPVRVGDLQVWLHRGRISPAVVGAYLVNAGLRIPAVCRCAHPPGDHSGACARPGCGCTAYREP